MDEMVLRDGGTVKAVIVISLCILFSGCSGSLLECRTSANSASDFDDFLEQTEPVVGRRYRLAGLYRGGFEVSLLGVGRGKPEALRTDDDVVVNACVYATPKCSRVLSKVLSIPRYMDTQYSEVGFVDAIVEFRRPNLTGEECLLGDVLVVSIVNIRRVDKVSRSLSGSQDDSQ